MKLGTKAENIKNIEGILQNAITLKSFVFTLGEWKQNSDNIWRNASLVGERLIIRSSCLDEDQEDASNAGKYLSVPNVIGKKAFFEAVEKVIYSYKDNHRQENYGDQILVQPMLEKVLICGVAFTVDPNTGGKYVVLNYDTSGNTDGVTSGTSKESKLVYFFKHSYEISNRIETEGFLDRLLMALQELEVLFEKDNLDVEFAVDYKENVYILQVRELCLRVNGIDDVIQTNTINCIYKKVCERQKRMPFLCGDRTIYSVMTDWNPAEMIGIYPKKLALSLYREIITDSVWAYQRDNYGYRNLRSFPLLVDFGGIPYIDVRVSFNSFIPAGLDEKISDKLVNYYLDRLAEHPSEHDKAEFNIVFSCYTFDLDERIQVLKKYGFLDNEIEKIMDALRTVTNQIINHNSGLWRKDYAKIEKLKERYEEIVKSNLTDIEKIYWLLEDCKRYGTLPFAGLARGAFVGVQLLKSMISVGIISKDDYDRFMSEVNSVSSLMKSDFRKLNKEDFLAKYGHLRPGTYDITIPRYDEDPDRYFEWTEIPEDEDVDTNDGFRLSLEQMHLLRENVAKSGLQNDILELFDFIRKVIEGREYGKFVFTRNLSKALQLIGKTGEEIGLTLDDMSYMDIHTVYELYSSSSDIETIIRNSVQKGKEEQIIKNSLRLPPVIIEPKDTLLFYYPESEPNYITLGKILGEVIDIAEVEKEVKLEGKIIMIPSADPGYDWIFSRGVCGFITMFGGANSHMAIRAGELGIPAVIGVGEQLYELYGKAKTIEIDAGAKHVTILKQRRDENEN